MNGQIEREGCIFLRYDSNEKNSLCFQLMRLQEVFHVIKFCSFIFVLHYVHSFLLVYGHISLNISWILFQTSLLLPLNWWYLTSFPMPFLSFRPLSAQQWLCSSYFNKDILKIFLVHLNKNVQCIGCVSGEEEKQTSEPYWRTGSFCQTRNCSLLL